MIEKIKDAVFKSATNNFEFSHEIRNDKTNIQI